MCLRWRLQSTQPFVSSKKTLCLLFFTLLLFIIGLLNVFVKSLFKVYSIWVYRQVLSQLSPLLLICEMSARAQPQTDKEHSESWIPLLNPKLMNFNLRPWSEMLTFSFCTYLRKRTSDPKPFSFRTLRTMCFTKPTNWWSVNTLILIKKVASGPRVKP